MWYRHCMPWAWAVNDRVALVLPNGPEMAVAFLAVGWCQRVHHSILPIVPTNLTSIWLICTPKR